MLTCPMCKKSVRPAGRACPTCRTDLSLLADYVDHIDEGLARADALAREGELGEAIWAYLHVLEVDPDNAEARRQVGQVAAAVRQFDRIAVGRRWMDKLHRQANFRRWAERWGEERRRALTAGLVAGGLFVLAAFVFGWWVGFEHGRTPVDPPRELLPMPAESDLPPR